mmetsp:Transcript_9087/g.31281  ORF Transcript_9087/g.31281 Transcript_9087/m.31281 type:complete len:210 (-) Transcript_9087:9-638(-)
MYHLYSPTSKTLDLSSRLEISEKFSIFHVNFPYRSPGLTPSSSSSANEVEGSKWASPTPPPCELPERPLPDPFLHSLLFSSRVCDRTPSTFLLSLLPPLSPLFEESPFAFALSPLAPLCGPLPFAFDALASWLGCSAPEEPLPPLPPTCSLSDDSPMVRRAASLAHSYVTPWSVSDPPGAADLVRPTPNPFASHRRAQQPARPPRRSPT